MARLGVMIEAQEGLDWDRWRRIVKDAERYGFAALRVSDHCQSTMGEDRSSVQSWLALALAAEWSESIELAPMVSPITFYEPGMLARLAIGVDQLSKGRLLLGVGAGWNPIEHEAFGIPFPSMRERFDRLDQGLALIEDVCSRVVGARKLPILIGGGGERRTLPLVARYATEWNGPSDLEAYRSKSALLEGYCAELGRDPGEIRRSIMTSCVIARDEAELLDRVGNLQEVLVQFRGMDRREALAALRQRWPVGTPEEIVTALRPYREAGIELIMLQHFALDDSDALRLLAEEVAPALA
ncbi:MAG TPA: LLM class flavin-dependent oxidoreductase [Candidatus Dormibacteraeota bacterium]|jgi:alkanesulfonate monooxygenase SsuD/methylene tetrahydromethanopterin reductase-like flavin-dependent oxidoreductase (luciferase family)|nr:LLM class flavin-dependent oxidoreductase [Candidatus Dormibacteraeota bacterium]